MKCKECGQAEDFEGRIAAILAFYGLKNPPKEIELKLESTLYIAAINKIRQELENGR